MRGRLLVPIAALLLFPAVLAGCGGSSSKSSAEADWAQSFCGALGTWKTSVTNAGKTFTNPSNLTKEKANQAVDSITNANDKLVSDLKALGKPEGSAGDQAKAEVQTLSNQLSDDADKARNAMKGVSNTQELLTSISTLAGIASSAASQVSSTFTQLKSLDASKEWQDAFENSDACKSLKQSS